jgi:2-keto-4-pentenoate hydratase/2-oxohepta-3-ene-1,7-dioic acid hydratase in catechol pathway
MRVESLALEDGRLSPRPAEADATLIQPGKIVAIGLNYLDHIRETGLEPPPAPLIFAKFPSTVIADGAAIEIDDTITERVDWEVELAVVIGRTARYVDEADALDYVYGYTIANDVSARDLQFRDGQWIRGKNLDTFCPVGPVVVTSDEITDPQRLAIRTRINGQLVQNSNTAEMIFPVTALVSYCSRHFTLSPGDLILTGTPWGCGEFMNPKRHLKPGDTVECEIDQIGTLTNFVVAAVDRRSNRGLAIGRR